MELVQVNLTRYANDLERLQQCLHSGMAAWVEAGEIVVRILEDDKDGIHVLTQALPELSEDIFYTLERLGKRQLHPRLLVTDNPGMKRLQSLSYAQQCRLLEEPVDVLIKNKDRIDTLKVRVENLTPAQCRQVFAPHSLRDLASQRAYLEAEERKVRLEIEGLVQADPCPYRIVGQKIIFRRDCVLTNREIKQLLELLDRK